MNLGPGCFSVDREPFGAPDQSHTQPLGLPVILCTLQARGLCLPGHHLPFCERRAVPLERGIKSASVGRQLPLWLLLLCPCAVQKSRLPLCENRGLPPTQVSFMGVGELNSKAAPV